MRVTLTIAGKQNSMFVFWTCV